MSGSPCRSQVVPSTGRLRMALDMRRAAASGLSRFLPGSSLLLARPAGALREPTGGTAHELSPEEIAFLARSWGCDGIVLDTGTGMPLGDCLLLREAARDYRLSLALRCGAPSTDALRHAPSPPDALEVSCCESPPDLVTLGRLVHEGSVFVEVTLPVRAIDGRRPGALARLCALTIANLGPWTPLHLVRSEPTVSDGMLRAARRGALAEGALEVNVPSLPDRSAPACPTCGSDLAECGYACAGRLDTAHGCCSACGLQIPGVWRVAGKRLSAP